jgi:hypothetical protein
MNYYKQKYLKYKQKYLKLKKIQIGGIIDIAYDLIIEYLTIGSVLIKTINTVNT